MTAGLPRTRISAYVRTPIAVARIHAHPSGPLKSKVSVFGEVMTATPNFATDAAVGAVDPAAPMASMGPFVLNLCSSTTPMALAQTDLAELKRFTFFVSRRFEEGRERFRLHMGYFATLAEAEEWLNVVREIYPGAWAGEAPGKKLRERAAAAQAAQAQHAAGPQPSVSPPRPPPVAVAPPPAPAAPEPEIPPGMSPLDAALSLRVPVLKAAPPAPVRPAAKAPPAALAAPAPAARKPAAAAPVAAAPAAPAAPPRKPAPPVAPKIAAPAAAKPAASIAKSPVAVPAAAKPAAPAISARPPAAVAAPAAKPQGAAAPARSEPVAKAEALTLDDKPRGVFGDSNVREVLKALGDASATGETRLMRAPLPPAPLKEAAPATPPKNPLSDTQVLKLLETRRPEGTEATGADPAHGAIPLLKPDDTGTREALKEAVTQDAPVLFAVQLQWSVQPVELDKVPPLAIFSAYTLYTVEGSRDSRKWFGLRLGFFSDAISAKQVAHYVRSEFASVAVVPVSAQEKARATDQDKQAATLNAPIAAPEQRVDEFKLIDDDTAQTEVAKLRAGQAAAPVPAATPKPVTDGKGRPLPGRPIPKVAVGRAVTQPAAAPPPPVAPAAAAAARGRGRTPGRVGAGEKRGAQSLEETLEILGAGQLSIDNGSGETLNESGVRHLRVEVQKNSPFSKLLERLSERMKKP
jgi:hypothetical protein